MAETATLEESIKGAIETEGGLATPEIEKPAATEIKADDKKDEPAGNEKKEEASNSDLTELEQAQALQLFQALKNPESSRTVIEFLARQAGLTETSTKTEVKEVKKTVVDVLKEALGPDLDYLAEKLGPVIKQVVAEETEEKTKDLRARAEATEHQKLIAEYSSAITNLAKTYFNKSELPDDILKEMDDLSDKVDPKNMSAVEYAEMLFHAVAGKKGIKAVDASQEDRRSRNRTDAPSRLASEGRREPVAQESSTYKSLHDAIQAAIVQVAEQEK